MFEFINNTGNTIADIEIIDSYIKHIVKKENLKKSIFDIIIIDNTEIKKINKEYRHIDKETDVISFALEDNKDVVYDDFRVLGDIYISIDKVHEQAKIYGHSELREMCFLITHGILHLLGYDHMEEHDEKIMFEKQERLLEEYEIKR